MLLVLDNGSVYTQNLVDFLDSNSIDHKRIEPHKLNISELNLFNSFILSGRRKNDSKTNALNSKIINHAISNKKSLLGICYGAEMLALTLGGTIKKMNILHKGNEEVEVITKNALCEGKISVFESHHFEISKLNGSLMNLGRSKICNNEIIYLENSKIFGTQFHPEMSTDGKKLIKKFLSL